MVRARQMVAPSRLFPNAGAKIITELSSPEDLPCLDETSYLTAELILRKSKGIAISESVKEGVESLNGGIVESERKFNIQRPISNQGNKPRTRRIFTGSTIGFPNPPQVRRPKL